MDVAITITVAVLVIAFCVGSWQLIVWVRKKDAEARVEAAKKTAAEIEVEHDAVLADEQDRTGEEAWEEFNRNYPPPG